MRNELLQNSLMLWQPCGTGPRIPTLQVTQQLQVRMGTPALASAISPRVSPATFQPCPGGPSSGLPRLCFFRYEPRR